MTKTRDHGGGLDAAIAQFGGSREDWVDLSTGINPAPYPLPDISAHAWAALPDQQAIRGLEDAARRFWNVPYQLEIVAAGGASALIAALPHVCEGRSVHIPTPTYNEHNAAFEANGWTTTAAPADVQVVVHPNNPDGKLWSKDDLNAATTIIDESFCDVTPEKSYVRQADTPSAIILKSFGKFWGLAGLRLGFAICPPVIATKLRDQLGPWAVSGPACQIGTQALNDFEWASRTRRHLKSSAERLDTLLDSANLEHVGGTDLFRLIATADAKAMHKHLAHHHVLTRIFAYSKTWIRFGLPGPEDQWDRLEFALKTRP